MVTAAEMGPHFLGKSGKGFSLDYSVVCGGKLSSLPDVSSFSRLAGETKMSSPPELSGLRESGTGFASSYR